MGTTWEEIETQAMIYIKNDYSLNYDLQFRLPVFYNRMAAYMRSAMAWFNRPPEVRFLLEEYTAPDYDQYLYTAEADLAAGDSLPVSVSGFDIAAVGIVAPDNVGTPTYTPVSIQSYDAESGDITIGEAVSAGTALTIDLYKSGSFEGTLTDTQKDILANCIYVVYEHRFDNNILERTAKIRDSSFTTVSEASTTQANTARLKQVDSELFDRLRAYEQSEEYIRVVMRRYG